MSGPESLTGDDFRQGDAALIGIAEEDDCFLEQSSHHDEVKLSDLSRKRD